MSVRVIHVSRVYRGCISKGHLDISKGHLGSPVITIDIEGSLISNHSRVSLRVAAGSFLGLRC